MLLAARGGAAAEAAREGSGGSYRVAATSLEQPRCSPSVRQSLRTALEARLALAHRAEMVGNREVQRERAR